MKTLIAWALGLFFLLGCGLALSGCAAVSATDASGQPVTLYRLTPKAEQTIDASAAVVEGVGGALTGMDLVYPGVGAIGGLLLGMAGVWRRLKPQLEDAKEGEAIGWQAGEATAKAIEDFKLNYPQEWEKLEALLKSKHGPAVENFYRAIRGMDPKI